MKTSTKVFTLLLALLVVGVLFVLLGHRDEAGVVASLGVLTLIGWAFLESIE